ncbi:MAG: hypothetical protein ACYDH2_09255 [Anaerolineaceae bacterium]
MVTFLASSELWSNVVGGIVAAGVLAGIAFLWDRRRQRTLQELIKIMGQAIEHRNIGDHKTFYDEKDWILKAKKIEEEAVIKAKKLSPTAGSLVEWLDRVPEWNATSEVDKYVSILSTVIERVRGLMERNS